MKHTENWGKNIEVKVAKFYLLPILYVQYSLHVILLLDLLRMQDGMMPFLPRATPQIKFKLK